jgi:hypothetical protein
MPTIGFDTTTGFGAATRPTTDPHFALTLAAGGAFTPSDSQEVYEVGFYSDTTPFASVQIGVIRADTLALIASGTVTASGSGRNVVSITPVALTTGVTYAVCWRIATEGTLYINPVGLDRGIRNSALTGANALANPFVNNGAALQTEFAIFATTRAVAASGGIPRFSAVYHQLRNNN